MAVNPSRPSRRAAASVPPVNRLTDLKFSYYIHLAAAPGHSSPQVGVNCVGPMWRRGGRMSVTDSNCCGGTTIRKRHEWLANRPWRRPDHPWHATHTAEHCGFCGRAIGAEEPVYWTRQLRRGSSPACGQCVNHDHYRQPCPCVGCGRPVYRHRNSVLRPHCSARCLWTFYNRRQAERRKAARQRVCAVCHAEFTPKRSDAQTCSAKCRTALYRSRRQEATAS